jgi:hypothetical protein
MGQGASNFVQVIKSAILNRSRGIIIMITRIGICTILAGLLMAIFNGVSKLMGVQNFWVDLTLSKLFGPERTESIITWFGPAFIQNSLDSLFYNVPFFGLLMFAGSICLAISFFVKEQ